MHKEIKAFTLIELLVVITIIVVLSAVSLFAVNRTKPQSQRIACSNNLKQMVIAFRSFAIDHDGKTPAQLSNAEGGDSDDVGFRAVEVSQRISDATGKYVSGSRGVSMIFLCMSNELSTPKILFCPAEYESYYRKAATNFSGTYDSTTNSVPFTNDLNVSYFIGVDALGPWPSPRMILTGDHNVGGNTNPPTIAYCAAPAVYAPGYAVWLGTNFGVNMGPAFMANQHDRQGNVGLADGSVECFSRLQFQVAVNHSGDVGRTPGTGFKPATGIGPLPGPGCNRIQLP